MLQRICKHCISCRPFSIVKQFSKVSTPWRKPFRTFQELLDKRPLITNSFIGGFFMFAGDMTQQMYFNTKIKWKEVAAFTSLGIIFGPVGAIWYKYLDIWLPGISGLQIAKKLVLDELAWGPLYAATVFYILPLVETANHEKALCELKEKFFPAWIGSAGFWLCFQTINFRFLPNKYRMPYLMALSFVFDTAIAIYRYQY